MSTSEFRLRGSMRVLLSLGLAVLVPALLLLELSQGRVSASRTIGVVLDAEATGLRVEEVVRAQPAADAGLLSADRIVSINGESIATWDDYDRATQAFLRGESQQFVVDRDGATSRLELVPGVAYGWLGFASYALAALLHIALGLLVLLQQQRDVRSRLLAILLIAVGVELAIVMADMLLGARVGAFLEGDARVHLTRIRFLLELSDTKM